MVSTVKHGPNSGIRYLYPIFRNAGAWLGRRRIHVHPCIVAITTSFGRGEFPLELMPRLISPNVSTIGGNIPGKVITPNCPSVSK